MDPRLPEPRMRDEFRGELRARLMREAVTALAPRTRTGWALLRPAMAIGLAGIILVAGAGTAAAGSLPGETAFPLKKAFEDVQVSLTFDDVQRVELLAQIADRRLRELQRAATSKGNVTSASEEFAQAVAKFRAAADKAQSGATTDTSKKVQQVVDNARDAHAPVVDQIQQQVNDDKAKDALDRARDAEVRNTTEEQKGGGDGDDNDPAKPGSARTARPSATQHADETRRAETPKPSPTREQRLIRTPTPSGRVDLDDPRD